MKELRLLQIGDKLYFQHKHFLTGEISLDVFTVTTSIRGKAVAAMITGVASASRRFVMECFKKNGEWCAKSVTKGGDESIAILENERLLAIANRLENIELIFNANKSVFAKMSNEDIQEIVNLISKYG